jgi:hypothetical protein
LSIKQLDTSLGEIEIIRDAQKKFCLWVHEQGCVSWSKIHKACQNIVDSLSEAKKQYFGNYPEYKIFVPLLKNGSMEVCRKEDRITLLYCMNPDMKIGNDDFQFIREKLWFSMYTLQDKNINSDIVRKLTFNSLDFLKVYPSIESQIETFLKADFACNLLKVYMNLYDYSYSQCKGCPSDTGIYKIADTAWHRFYLLDKKNIIRQIPRNDENPDALNLARLYIRITNLAFVKPLFEYNTQTKDLKCFYYSELPILLVRILLLFTPEQITETQFCLPYPNVPFRNIEREVVVEIRRIFSGNSVKII